MKSLKKEAGPPHKKQILTVTELKEFLKDKVIILDCGHRFTLHPLSNTFVMTATGKTYCHNCYQ